MAWDTARPVKSVLRAFARYLDREGHDGPIPLESSLDWASSTASPDPYNPSRRLTTVRGFLRHLSALDGATEVPAPGMLGPTGHRTPPHVYSDREIADLLRAAAGLVPAGGLRPRCYATLFGLLACTGLRISEALALSCADVDLAGGILTVRAGKRGRTRLVPLHPSALAPLADYAAERERRYGPPGDDAVFFRTDRSDHISYNAANHTFTVLRRQLGWTAAGREHRRGVLVVGWRVVRAVGCRRMGSDGPLLGEFPGAGAVGREQTVCTRPTGRWP